MVNKSTLILHTSEWDRLRKQATLTGSALEAADSPADEERLALIEKSKKWVQSWTNSPESYKKRILEKREHKKEQEIADALIFTEKFKNKLSDKHERAMETAKKMIFDDTGYGRELTSAFLESRAIEERELQIKLKQEINEKVIATEKETQYKTPYEEIEEENTKRTQARKERDIECANINKAIFQMEKKKQEADKHVDKEQARQDAEMMLKLLQYEMKEQNKCKEIWKAEAKEYMKEKESYSLNKEKIQKLDEALAQIWQDYYIRKQCRLKTVYDQVHKEKDNKEAYQKNFELLQNYKDQEQKSYDDFIKKGMDRLEKQIQEREQEEIKQNEAVRKKRLSLANNHKAMAASRLSEGFRDHNKLLSHKQTLFSKSFIERTKKQQCKGGPETTKHNAPTFLCPNNKLVQSLRKRAEDPSPWSGTRATHEYFARQANEVLKQCKHKTMANRVVNEYRKRNGLDSFSLPVSNN